MVLVNEYKLNIEIKPLYDNEKISRSHSNYLKKQTHKKSDGHNFVKKHKRHRKRNKCDDVEESN